MLLDDLKQINRLDTADAFGAAEKQWQQITYDFMVEMPKIANIKNIVVAASGESAIAALYVRSWPGSLMPIDVIVDYEVPEYVNTDTLFIAANASEEVEDIRFALNAVEKRGAHIAVVTGGSGLAALAREKSYPLFSLPDEIYTRVTCLYFFAALLQLLQPMHLIPDDALQELYSAAAWLRDKMNAWRSNIPSEHNPAKQLALDIVGNSVVFYSSPKFFPVAYKWKINMNQYAKNLAWTNRYPEFQYTEFAAWAGYPVQKPYAVVEIRSNLDHERMQKQYAINDRLLSGMRPEPYVVEPQGNSLCQQLIWSSVFSDFTSLYTAILNGVDPSV